MTRFFGDSGDGSVRVNIGGYGELAESLPQALFSGCTGIGRIVLCVEIIVDGIGCFYIYHFDFQLDGSVGIDNDFDVCILSFTEHEFRTQHSSATQGEQADYGNQGNQCTCVEEEVY